MSNIMSAELIEWSELCKTVKSPVAANLTSLLRSMSALTDPELLNLELPVVRNRVTVWNSSKHDYDDALDLPEGCLLSGIFQVDVNLSTLKDAVEYLQQNPNGSFWEATTQAEIIRKAFPDTFR